MSFWNNYNASKGRAENTRLSRAQAFEQFRKSNPQATYQDWVNELNRLTGGRPSSVISSQELLKRQFQEKQRARQRQLYQERAADLNTQLQLQQSVDGLIERQAVAQDNDAQVMENVLLRYNNDPQIRDYIYQRYPQGFSGIRERHRLQLINDNKGLVVDALRRDENADVGQLFPYLNPTEIDALRSSAMDDIKKLNLSEQSSNLNEELSRLNVMAQSGDPEALRSYEPLLSLEGPALAQFNLKRQAAIARLEQANLQKSQDREYVLDERADDEFDEEVSMMRDHYARGAPGIYEPKLQMSPQQQRQFRALEAAAIQDRQQQSSQQDTAKLNAAVDRFANSDQAKIILATPGFGREELTAALLRGLESQGVDPSSIPAQQINASVDMILGRAENMRAIEYSSFRDGYVDTRQSVFAKRNSQAAAILTEQLTNPDGPAGQYAPALAVVLPQIGANFDLVSDPSAMARVYGALTEEALEDADIDPNNPGEILQHIQNKLSLAPASTKANQYKRELDLLPRQNTTFDEYYSGLEASASNALTDTRTSITELFGSLEQTDDPFAALKSLENEILIRMESLETSVELASKHKNAWLTERGMPWSEDAVDNLLGGALLELSKLRSQVLQRAEAMQTAHEQELEQQDEQIKTERIETKAEDINERVARISSMQNNPNFLPPPIPAPYQEPVDDLNERILGIPRPQPKPIRYRTGRTF